MSQGPWPRSICVSLMGGFLPICAVTHGSLAHWPSKEGSVSESVCVCLSVCERGRGGSRVCCLRFLPLLLPGPPDLALFIWLTPHPAGFNSNVTSKRPSLTQASSATTDLSPTLFFQSPHPLFSTISLTSSQAVFVHTFLNTWLPHNTGNPPPPLQPRGGRRVGVWRGLSKHP